MEGVVDELRPRVGLIHVEAEVVADEGAIGDDDPRHGIDGGTLIGRAREGEAGDEEADVRRAEAHAEDLVPGKGAQRHTPAAGILEDQVPGAIDGQGRGEVVGAGHDADLGDRPGGGVGEGGREVGDRAHGL